MAAALLGVVLSFLWILDDLGGHVILGQLQPLSDPGQVAGQFDEHQATAAIAICRRRD